MHLRVDRNLILLGIALVVVVLVAWIQRHEHARGEGGIGATMVASALTPLQKGLTATSHHVSNVWSVFHEVRHLHSDNQRLRAQVDRLTQQVNALRENEQENVQLREMLGYRQTLPNGGEKALPATVIGMQPTNWFNSITIDCGSRQGVREKQMVLTPRGLVGQVRMVTATTATVLLITDLNNGVGARIQRTGWNGVIEGTAGPLLKMQFLPRDADVRRGDKVVTSGMGSIFREKGIMIGTVQSVRLDENTSVKVAIVRPAADFRRLQEVFVMVE